MAAAATRWEYWIEDVQVVERWAPKRKADEMQQFRDRLNALGNKLWEMVSFETVPLTGAFSGNIKGYMYLAFFKRPKQSPEAGVETGSSAFLRDVIGA